MDYKHYAKLTKLVENKTPVVMFLTNGVQLHGTIKGYDGDTILFEENGVENVCWIHAVSTVRIAREPRRNR